MTALVPVDTTNAIAVSDYLSRARDWLATAVEMTGPEQIAMAKAEIATAAEATKQLGLSKEIQEDAREMVRRAEYALRKATLRAQEAGEVRSRQTNLIPGARTRSHEGMSSSDLPSPKDFFGSQSEYDDANAMGALSEDEFDAAIDEAKAEGNLSRANVARKAREKSGAQQEPRRTPLVDSARIAGQELRKAIERLERLAADDRFARNKDEVAAHLRHHLARAIEVCQDLNSQIN